MIGRRAWLGLLCSFGATHPLYWSTEYIHTQHLRLQLPDVQWDYNHNQVYVYTCVCVSMYVCMYVYTYKLNDNSCMNRYARPFTREFQAPALDRKLKEEVCSQEMLIKLLYSCMMCATCMYVPWKSMYGLSAFMFWLARSYEVYTCMDTRSFLCKLHDSN